MRSVKGVGSQRTTLPPPASHREPHPAPPQWRRNLLALVQSNWSFRQALLDRKLVRRARSCGGPPRVTRLAAHASPETLIEGPPAWRQLSNQTSGGARLSQSKATGSNSLLHDVAQTRSRRISRMLVLESQIKLLPALMRSLSRPRASAAQRAQLSSGPVPVHHHHQGQRCFEFARLAAVPSTQLIAG
jgi:hypothetical protein